MILKILDKNKLAEIRRWKFYKLKFSWKDWDYALVSSDGGSWVVVFAKDKKENVCLLKIYRHAIENFSREIVRGWIEENESFKDAGIREFQEEFWISDDPVNSEVLGDLYIDSWLIDHNIKVVFLQFEDFSRYNVWKKLDGSYENIVERIFLPLKQFEKWIAKNIIKDNFTLAAYSLVKSKWLI